MHTLVKSWRETQSQVLDQLILPVWRRQIKQLIYKVISEIKHPTCGKIVHTLVKSWRETSSAQVEFVLASAFVIVDSLLICGPVLQCQDVLETHVRVDCSHNKLESSRRNILRAAAKLICGGGLLWAPLTCTR